MFLKVSSREIPLFHACGCLVSNEAFLHANRMNSDYLLIIGMKETLHLVVQNEAVDVAPNELLMIPPFTPHRGRTPSKNITFFWLHFWLSGKEHLLSDQEVFEASDTYFQKKDHEQLLISCHFPLPNMTRAFVLCKQILDYAASAPHFAPKINSHLIAALLMELADQTFSSGAMHFNNHSTLRFEHIAEWVRINAYRNLTMQEVSNRFNYNSNYLSNLFKKETGFSLKQYMIASRINLAKEYLLLTDLPVQSVAQRVGFTDEKHFMKVFKKREVLTPSEYRNAYSRTSFQGHSSLTPRTAQNVLNETAFSIKHKESGSPPISQSNFQYFLPQTIHFQQDAHYFKFICPNCSAFVYGIHATKLTCSLCHCEMLIASEDTRI